MTSSIVYVRLDTSYPIYWRYLAHGAIVAYQFVTKPSKFYQLSDSSDHSRRRFRKEILRVGKWRVGEHIWNVTKDVLQSIKDTYHKLIQDGHPAPFIWDHSNDPRNRIGDVVELELTDDDTLSAVVTASRDTDIEHLSKVNHDVSVKVYPEWTDGSSRTYKHALRHLGVVLEPVVGSQSSFVTLSLDNGDAKMDGETPTETPAENTNAGPADDATDMSVADVKAILKELFSTEIPDEVDTVKELKLFLKGTMGTSPTEADAPEAEPVVPDMPVEQMGLTQARDKAKALELQLQNMKAARVEDAKRSYELSLDKHVQAGRITPANRSSLMEAGKLAGYSLSLLEPFDSMVSVNDLGSQVKSMSVTGGGTSYESMSAEDKKKFRASKGL